VTYAHAGFSFLGECWTPSDSSGSASSICLSIWWKAFVDALGKLDGLAVSDDVAVPDVMLEAEQLCATSCYVEKNDHSITAKIARLNRKLSSLRNGLNYVTPLNDIAERGRNNIAEWGRNILETKSKEHSQDT
jgi:hypothetical protein